MLIDLGPRGSSTDVRAANTQRVLDVLRANAREWLPVRVISEISGISRPTVTRVCEALVDSGWASMNEGVSQGVGRPAREFRFRAEHQSIAAVILRPDEVRVQLGDLSGEVLATQHRTGVDLRHPADAADAVVRMVQAAGDDAKRHRSPAALSLSVPGMVSPDGEIWNSPKAPAWANSSLVEHVRRLMPGTLIIASNDAHLAAQAELTHGVLSGVDSAVYLHPTRECELVPIIGGRVYLGANGAAGTHTAEEPPPLRGTLGFDELVFLHEGGDATATATLTGHFKQACEMAAIKLSAFDPHVVVLGGVLAKVKDLIIPLLTQELAELVRHPPHVIASALTDGSAPLRGGLDAALAKLDLEHVAAM